MAGAQVDERPDPATELGWRVMYIKCLLSGRWRGVVIIDGRMLSLLPQTSMKEDWQRVPLSLERHTDDLRGSGAIHGKPSWAQGTW